jgi:diacylglycerol kinase family enzyme
MEAPLGTISRALVIANLRSGAAGLGALKAALDSHAGSIEWRIRRIREDEDVTQVTREEMGEAWDVVVAAGGDGTVSGVAQAAGEAGVPVLIAPMGTANMLAVQLEVPTDLDGALALLERPAMVKYIDGMEIDGSLHLLSAGVGVSAKTIQDLSDTSKHRFGLPAYLWTGVASTFKFRPMRCTVSIDGRKRRLRILDVSVLNAGFRSEHPTPGFPDIRPDDGKLDVLVVWTPSPVEYLRHLRDALLFWRRVDPNIMWTTAEHGVEIDCREPLPVQADGDLIKETPVTIRLVQGAVGVVVPQLPESADK